MAVGAIPWTAIVQWADREFGDDREAAQILIDVIRRLDIDRAAAQTSERQKDTALGANRARGRTP